mmetsp:Transcript_17748/g.54179  ORF Transcript_17748/g.54179 Transcript_17748/m.54179 type:complete len:287 (+) Transcript_17748:917-1777(+)
MPLCLAGTSIEPLSTSSSPRIACSSADLPQPVSPTTATNSPRRTDKDTDSTTGDASRSPLDHARAASSTRTSMSSCPPCVASLHSSSMTALLLLRSSTTCCCCLCCCAASSTSGRLRNLPMRWQETLTAGMVSTFFERTTRKSLATQKSARTLAALPTLRFADSRRSARRSSSFRKACVENAANAATAGDAKLRPEESATRIWARRIDAASTARFASMRFSNAFSQPHVFTLNMLCRTSEVSLIRSSVALTVSLRRRPKLRLRASWATMQRLRTPVPARALAKPMW